MKKSLPEYYKEATKNFGEAVINLFLFLPYFFSAGNLTRTFFAPWRNLVFIKTTIGFTFSDSINRFSSNFISRAVGSLMRFSILMFYLFFQATFMMTLPFTALIYFLLVPIFYLNYLWQKTDQEKKEIAQKNFFDKRMLNKENVDEVSAWFNDYYQKRFLKNYWWSRENLFSMPPLARDWAVGYTPILDSYSTDLASGSYLHHIKNIVDRQTEIREIENILAKDLQANVLIVGEEGVGKHTIVDALAKRIYLGQTNIHLMYRRILKLNMEKILDQYTDVKKREAFFEELLKEAYDASNIILFIDNFEKYIELDISLEKYAKGNRLLIIGVTSPFFYEKNIFGNEKIRRLFEKVDVVEVEKNSAFKILLSAVFDFENYHRVIIPYETVKELLEKSEFYITYIPFPEKAVDLLDQSCVYVKSQGRNIVRPVDVDSVITEKTHIPTTITGNMKEKLVNLEALLSEKIVEQNEAIRQLSSALRRSFLLMGKRKKPLASFLFLGPTGSGKTETAKVTGEVFFGENQEQLIRFDMSLYQSKSDIQKLIGDQRYNEPGLLSSSIREKPYGVLLLDEIEKADKDLLNIFLTIFDEGYFADGTGRRVDCKNLLIVATSNAASDYIYENKNDVSAINDYLVEKHIFSPEFLNRFDGVIVFKQLSEKSLIEIGKKNVEKISQDVFELYKVKINVSSETIEQIVKKSYDPRFGARNLYRAIQDNLEDKLAKIMLGHQVKAGEIIDL